MYIVLKLISLHFMKYVSVVSCDPLELIVSFY